MKIEIGYRLKHDYWKESYGQGSWWTDTEEGHFLPWDGRQSFKDSIVSAEPDFIARSVSGDGDRNFRAVVTCLRIGGEASSVIIPVEEQTIEF